MARLREPMREVLAKACTAIARGRGRTGSISGLVHTKKKHTHTHKKQNFLLVHPTTRALFYSGLPYSCPSKLVQLFLPTFLLPHPSPLLCECRKSQSVKGKKKKRRKKRELASKVEMEEGR